MSYDINFWKLTKPTKRKPNEIYSDLSAGKSPRGLAKLPVAAILRELQGAFPDLDTQHPMPVVKTARGSIEFSWSDRHFRFDFRGVDEALFQRIVRIMRKFGCPLYDPQLDKRYDVKNGTGLGTVPREKESGPSLVRIGNNYYFVAR